MHLAPEGDEAEDEEAEEQDDEEEAEFAEPAESSEAPAKREAKVRAMAPCVQALRQRQRG